MEMEVKTYHQLFKERGRVDFEMFSVGGNGACTALVNKINRKICGSKKVTKDEIIKMIEDGMKKISEKHEEVYDTEPPYHIMIYVNNCLKSEGYAFRINL